jgi:hypothetical protein
MAQDQIEAAGYDWIAARHACSPTHAFIVLREQVMADVERRRALMKEVEKENYQFSTGSRDWMFWVSVSGSYVDKGVAFHRSATGISVRDAANDAPLLEGKLTLDNDGECKLKVGENIYSFWQFRKLALENVLFTSVAKWSF